VSTAVAAGPAGPYTRRAPLPAILIVVLAVLAGLAAGDPSPLWWAPLAAVAGSAVLYAGYRWPFTGLLLMLGSSILLVVVRASGLRAVNLIDVLLPPVLLASVLGGARAAARADEKRGESHDLLHAAERRFTRAVLLFFGLAALSLLLIARHSGAGAALDSGLVLTRALQGLLLYPLCTWWLRTRERVERAWGALFVAGFALALTNLVAVTALGVKRAGMTLYVNDPDAPFASPNEAGTATLIVGVVLLVRHAMRPQWRNLALGALVLFVLALTQSRSGLLAWGTFGLLTLRWVRPSRLIAGAASLAALLPLLPQAFWDRMARSVMVDRGSFEALSFFQRVYGWHAAWLVLLDHPWTGVGYLGFRFVSHAYNDLRLVIGTVENYYFEILVSMGVVGLAMLLLVIVELFRLGRAVGRVAPSGTLAHHMSRYHAPLVLGLLVANLTGDNFVGIVAVAQMAMWTAVLVQSGHAALAGDARG
jgi:O-antigen ligase